MRSAYWTRVGSIWRERKTSVLFAAYLLIGLPLSGELAYGSLYFLLLGLFLLLLYVVEKWKGPRVWMMVGLAVLVLLFDNVLIRDLNAWLQFRYIFLLLAAIFLMFRPALWRGVRYFLLLNLLYVVVFYWNAGRLKEVKLYPGKEKGLVRKQIDQWVGEKKDMVVIMLDGYPAERILKDSFGLRSSIREVYPFLSYRENRSVYLESPLSVTHQLFSIRTDRTRDVLGQNSDVFRLFADGRRLAAWDHSLEGYEQHWISYFNDKDVYNRYLLPFWRPDPFRAFIRLLLWKKLHALISLRKVTGYNNWVLDQLTLVPQVKTKPRFLFLYFLTFHNAGYSVQQDVADSGRYLEQALKQLKGAYQLIIFSDHGIRHDVFSREDQSAGIYYSGEISP